MTSFQPQNGEIYNLGDLYDNKVEGFTRYTKIKDRPFLKDDKDIPNHYYNLRQHSSHTVSGPSRPISIDSEFEYRNIDVPHYYPRRIITTDPNYGRRQITEPIQNTKYYRTYFDDAGTTRTRYLSQYDRNSRQFSPIIVTDDDGGRYSVSHTSQVLQDNTNHFTNLDLLPVDSFNSPFSGENPSRLRPRLVRQDDGSYHKILETIILMVVLKHINVIVLIQMQII